MYKPIQFLSGSHSTEEHVETISARTRTARDSADPAWNGRCLCAYICKPKGLWMCIHMVPFHDIDSVYNTENQGSHTDTYVNVLTVCTKYVRVYTDNNLTISITTSD